MRQVQKVHSQSLKQMDCFTPISPGSPSANDAGRWAMRERDVVRKKSTCISLKEVQAGRCTKEDHGQKELCVLDPMRELNV